MSSAPLSPRRARLRRLGRVAGITAAVLAVILLLAAAGLHLPAGRRLVLALVVDRLKTLQIGFAADEIRYNFAALSISMRNARVSALGAPDLEPFVTIDRASVDLSLRNVLRGRYLVDSARFSGVNLHYVVAADGRTNLPVPPEAVPPSEPSDPIDYLLDDVVVERARVRFEDRGRDIDVVVPVERLVIDGHPLTGRHDARLTASGGTARLRDRRVVIDALTADIDLGDDDVVARRVELRAEGSHAVVSGRISDFDAPTLDVTTEAEIDTARAAAIARVDERLSGLVRVDGAARGPIDRLVVTARLASDAISARGLAPAAFSADGGYDTAQRMASIAAFELTAPWAHAVGEGQVALDDRSTTRLAARVDGVDARALSTALALPYGVASRLDATIDATLPGLRYREGSGHATLTLTPSTTVVSPRVLPVGGLVHATARDGDLVADIRRLDALSTRMTGRVVVGGGGSLGGQLQARAGALERVIPAVEMLLGRPRGSLVPTRVAGPMEVAATLGGRLEAPTARATLVAPGLRVGELDGVMVAAAADYNPRQVVLHHLDASWQGAALGASGSVSLVGAQALDLRATAEALDVAAVLSALGRRDVPAAGRVDAEAAVAGSLANPRADVQLSAQNLVAYGELLGRVALDARLANRVARIEALTLEKPQQGETGRLTASGEYHLDTRRYSFDLDSENLRLESLTLPDATPVRGTLEVSGEGKGTTRDPGGTLRVAVRSLRAADKALGDVAATVALADRRARFEAEAPRFAATLSGEVGIESPYAAQVDLTVQGLALEALPLDLDTPLAGRVTARVKAEGSASDPAAATVAATIETLDATWNGQPIALDGPATGSYANRVVTIDQLRVMARESTVAISGRVPVDADAAPGVLDVDARLQLASLASYAPADMEIDADGTAIVAGKIVGSLQAIDPDLVIEIHDGRVVAPALGAPVEGLQLRARVADGAATLDTLTAAWDTARLEATGRAPLAILGELPIRLAAAEGAATLRARLSGVNPAAIPGAPAGVSGRVGVSVEATAASPNLASLTGRATFDELDVAFRGLTLAQRAPSVISLADGIASIEQFGLEGSVGHVTASGTVGLTGERPLNASAEGTLDIAALSTITDDIALEGPATFEVVASGSASEPILRGFLELSDATVALDEPAVAVEGLRARLDLAGARMTLSSLSGLVNGGALSGSGFVVLGKDLVEDIDLQLAVNGVAMSAPLDLRSLSDAAIRISRQDDLFLVDGKVSIAEAGLTGDINFDTGLLATIGAPRGLDLTEERNPLLERVRFNVTVDTKTPILVDNNLAKAEVTADLRVLGTPYDMGLSGRLELLSGSSVTLNERRYAVERGQITFTDETRIAPSFDLQLTTATRHYDITLGVTGDIDEPETMLSSNPALPEPDIMALLVTGRTLDEMRGEEYDIAREQVLSYLTGRVGSSLGRGIQRATGLSEVRIEPNLIANEANPGARLTVGQDLTDDLSLVYSTDLADSSNQIWVAEYDITRRFQTRVVRERDNNYRFDFRHDVRFGGAPEPRRIERTRPTLASVDISVDAPLDADGRAAGVQGTAPPAASSHLRDLLGVEAGDQYDFFAVREGVERIEKSLRESGYLQSRVRVQRAVEDEETTAAVRVAVETGPRVEIRFAGAAPPAGVQEDVALRWHRGVFDSQRGGDGLEVLRGWLMEDRHLDPRLEYRVDDSADGVRRVLFTVEPGAQYAKVALVFEGTRGIEPDVLRGIVEDQDLEQDLFTDPVVVTELLRRYYREEGYLAAAIDEPDIEFAGAEARVVLRVTEGPRFTVTRLATVGNRALDTATLLDEAPLRVGDPFLPAVAERSVTRIRQAYWRRGYSDVRLRYEIDANRESGSAAVSLLVEEGPRSVVTAVRVEGTDRTTQDFVRKEIELAPAETLDVAALGRSRRNLYKTGAYSAVEITRETATAGGAGVEDGDAPGAGETRPITLNVAVREVQPYQVSYGASYNTEGGIGGLVDLSNHNWLGKGRVLGLAGRYDSQVRQARLYFSQPMLRSFPLQTTAAVYFREERNPLTDVSQGFNEDRLGASLEQERQLRNHYIWNYGVRFDRVRTFDPRPGGILDETVTVTPLTSTFTRETRDEPLDATRGSFLSQAFSYAPGWLGSETPYLKYYGQYFTYVALQPERRERLTHEILRPRLVYATGVRLGLARGIGGVEVPLSERFLAGGSTTLRGFAQHAVGPIGPDGIPRGGNATLILNNELRFPLVGMVDGVGFLDIGGVFPGLDAWSWDDIREAAGIGVRVRTPWFLIRGDYGFVLDRRPGEGRGRFFFSIGQAF